MTSELISFLNLTVEVEARHTPGQTGCFDEFKVYLISAKPPRKRLDITDYLTDQEYKSLYDELVRATDTA